MAKVLRFLRTSLADVLQPVDLTPFRREAGYVNNAKYRVAGWFDKTQLTAFKRMGEIERRWDSTFINF